MAPNVAIYTAGHPASGGKKQCVNTALKLPSEIMSGLAEIPLFYQAYISEITLLSAAKCCNKGHSGLVDCSRNPCKVIRKITKKINSIISEIEN